MSKGKGTVLRTKQNGGKARSVVQSIRLAKSERAELRLRARAAGVSVSDYVRAALSLKDLVGGGR